MEPISDYHADNSRSDLSDILEEEEEDLYFDHLSEKQGRGYTFEANRVKKLLQSYVLFVMFLLQVFIHWFCSFQDICEQV